jgi:hypothetical protein
LRFTLFSNIQVEAFVIRTNLHKTKLFQAPIVVLAFVINVSLEKFKMRSMCFSFVSVLKCASCA